MLKFLTLAVKGQLNVHDLNNETGAGNVTDIRIMEFLDENGNKVEAPSVSGRMLKHWHYEAIRNLILNEKYKDVNLCDGCKSGEPIRPGKLENNQLLQVAKSEDNAVKECAICDIHGYLIAQGAKKEGEIGVSSRRSSRAMFSWLMPIHNTEFTSKQVIHTRVSQQESMSEGEGAAQMIFNKSYASGFYAFVSALDIERIGLVELNLGTDNPYAINDTDHKNRAKVAIEAYRYLISGQMGASLSHSIPHWNPVEMLVIYSENGPLPFPVSPMYANYIEKTKGTTPNGAKILYWGDEEKTGVEKKDSINEILDEILSKL